MNRNNLLYTPCIFKVIGIVTLSFLLTSCMAYKKYPSEWSELIPVEENKCPDISGVYRDHNVPYNLSEVLGFKNKIGEYLIQIIQSKDGTFEIFGCDMEEQKLVNKKFYAKKKYRCTEKGVKTSSYKKSVFKPEGFSPVGYVFGSFYLTRNRDGDLVVKDTGTLIALSVIPPFPLMGAGADWYRFLLEDLREE